MRKSQSSNNARKSLTGRHQILYRNPGQAFERPTLAAGAVLWRGELPEPEIAVVHRPHYDDWSLAKGKVDPGESLPITAAREVEEETGYEIRLGKLLGNIHYPVGNRTKVVFYWTAEVIGGEFEPNSEVDEIRWLSIADAIECLSYPDDQEVVRKAAKRFHSGVDSTLLIVRSAKTAAQLEFLIPLLHAYRPEAIACSNQLTALDTAVPIGAALGLPVTINPSFDSSGWMKSMKTSQAKLMELLRNAPVSILVTDKRMIEDSIAWLSVNGTLPLESIPAKKAS
ncbi:MAG: NUDIX hydrolase, partial [Corynebacterium sp.]|nr:NUDIX hydrolase [Corynebacterium sp.]